MPRPVRLLMVGVLVAAVVVGGGFALLAARNADAPSPVGLGSQGSGPTVPPTGADPAEAEARTGTEGAADGRWAVRTGDDTFVGYRVREQLAFASSPNEAVGRTRAVTGTMEVSGDRVSAARIEADLRELRSDESRRDNAIRRAGLQSEQFPTATFELTAPLVLDGPVTAGRALTGQGRGELTVHGTTREVTVPLQGRWDGDTIQVTGRLPVRLTDFGIDPPRLGPVVSIDDEATVELQLVFARA